MFVTPQHQVKELRDEVGRNIVGGTMLCSELGRGDVGGEGGYIRTCRKSKEGRGRGRNRRGERKGEKEGEQGGKGGMHMHTYVLVL